MRGSKRRQQGLIVTPAGAPEAGAKDGKTNLEHYREQTAPVLAWYESRGGVTKIAAVGSVAEAFSWFSTSVSVGIAGGSVAGGWLIDTQGWRTSVVLTSRSSMNTFVASPYRDASALATWTGLGLK